MSLVERQQIAETRIARIARTLRPWWPQRLIADDPVDAALVAWLSPGRFVYAGLILIVVVFGGLALWNGGRALEKGAMADATVEPASHRKVVSSRFGGVIRELYVRENDEVKAGQTLLVMDSTEAAAQAAMYTHQRFSELARSTRLAAIRDGAQPAWPQELLDAAEQDPRIAASLALNRKIFVETTQTLENQLAGVDLQIRQTQEVITSRRAIVEALREQRALIKQELGSVEMLLEQGLERKPKLLELRRTESGLNGQISANQADIARAEVQMRELSLRMENARAEQRQKAIKELQDSQAREMELRELARGQTYVVERQVITAPQSGRVLGIKTRTIGAAVQPTDTILELVPNDDTLLLRVTVSPHDVTDVRPGTKARVNIEGDARGMRNLSGVVTEVSPDLMPHPRNPNASTYIAEVEVHTNELPRETLKKLRPGMQAHVKLITGTRSLWTYMTESLFDALHSHERLLEENSGQ
jgi:HlyD family type I secretion membrane fusion protein